MKRVLLLFPIVALVGLPAPAAIAAQPGQFVLRCAYSHTLMDDPIVFPGQPGASHMHDFFGNVTANAFSTVDSMLAGETTCRVPSDTAGYWTPTASVDGVQIRPGVMRIYYLGPSSGRVETIPPGLQMVAGNRDATTPAENPHVRWNCGQTTEVHTPNEDTPYDCTPWSSYSFVDGVVAVIDFPSCWNGQGLQPGDVTYPANGFCPSGFEHVLPKLSERVHLGVMNPLAADGTVALTFSNGPWYAMHADFWNTWQQELLDQLVADCLVAKVHCGSVDASSSIAWSRQFGTVRYDLAYAAAPDGEGGSYAAGFTNFALPGQTYRHNYDAFLTRYDINGRERWTRQFGTNGRDQAFAIAVDGRNVYVAGSTDGRFPRQRHAGGLDAFVARYDASGDRRSLVQFGTPRDDQVNGLATSGDAVFASGTTEGSLFGAERGGMSDAFVTGLTPDGTERWTRQLGGQGEDQGLAVAALGGRVFVAGSTEGLRRRAADLDGFVGAFRTQGAPVWRYQAGGTSADVFTSIVPKANGVYFAGSTSGQFLRDPPLGGIDAIVGKLDLDGSVSWYRQFGSPADDEAAALTFAAKGLYVAGSTTGSLPEGTALGESDGFLIKFLLKGTEVWTRQFGTNDFDRVYGMASDQRGVTVVGTTHGAFEGQTNAGDRDVFLTRIAFA